MRLLLASQGITNKSIGKAFFDLVGKKAAEITVAFIPTAVYGASTVNKSWMVDNIISLHNLGIGKIDIVEPLAMPKEMWLPRLERADVIFVEGGSPIWAHDAFEKTGFLAALPKLLEDKVYVGCSTGSMLLGEMVVSSKKTEFPDGTLEFKNFHGLGLVHFSIRPHFYRPDKADFTEKMVADLAKKYDTRYYAIDDDTALLVDGDKFEVISEGKWKEFK